MGGMKSAERYDAKEAYDKDLSSKARMHYLENDIADKKGSPAHIKGSQTDHQQSSKEFAEHEARVGTAGHGLSRKSSPVSNYKKGYYGK